MLEFLDVLGEKEVGYAGHGMDGALAKVRGGAMGGFTESFEAQPKVSFVGGDDL